MTNEDFQPQGAPCGAAPLLPDDQRQRHFILDRWQVLSAVKSVSRHLGLSEREITVLTAHLSVLAKGLVRSDTVLISYAGLPTLLERANCMDERRFRRGEARLEAVGLIRRKLSANARRFPVRDGKGRVVDGYGVDLRPLFESHPALLTLQTEIARMDAARAALKSSISARLSDLRRHLEAGLGHIPDEVAALAQTVRNIMRRTRISLAELTALDRQVSEQVAEMTPVEEPGLPDEYAGDAGQNVRHSELQRKEITLGASRRPTENAETIWISCDKLAEFHDDAPRNLTVLSQRLYEFGGYLGLSENTRRRALERLGLPSSAQLFNDIAAKILTISDPESYVLAILSRWRSRGYDRGHKKAIGVL